MGWRERLPVRMSRAESDLLIRLQKERILWLYGKKIVLSYEKRHVTIPDAIAVNPDKPYYDIPIYLDGIVHEKGKSLVWDVYVDETLKRLGFKKVIRVPYRGILSKKKLDKIIGEIRSCWGSDSDG